MLILAPPPAPMLDAHDALTNAASVAITGTATGSAGTPTTLFSFFLDLNY